MSNELTLIQTNGQLPAYLQQQGLGYQESGLGAGITPRAPKLGITTAKQWTVTKDGQTLILPQQTVRGVFIASAMNITKAWYEKAFTPGSNEAPDCYSDDGRSPAAGVKKPQCSNCAACPKNAFGSHPTTGRGKACSDRKRVIFVWEHLPKELMTFNVPTMSLQGLQKLDNELRNANIPLQAVMVELSFDPSVIYPVVKISAIGYVAQEQALELIDRASSQEVADLLREAEFDATDAPQAPAAPLVPNQTITMGQAAPEQYAPQGAAAGAPQPIPEAAPPAAPKRTRRTKAQMEADALAQAQAQMQAQQQAQNPSPVAEQLAAFDAQMTVAVDPAAAQIAALQAQLAALQQGGQQPQVVAGTNTPAPEVIQQAAVQQPAATPPAGGQVDVASLISKWQNG